MATPSMELDMRANEIIIDELIDAPVAYLASEELELPVPINQGAPLYVAIDPLDGSSNIDTNVSVGTIFSVMPMKCDKGDANPTVFCKKEPINWPPATSSMVRRRRW